jgi:hypothetical protein
LSNFVDQLYEKNNELQKFLKKKVLKLSMIPGSSRKENCSYKFPMIEYFDYFPSVKQYHDDGDDGDDDGDGDG